MKAVSIYKKAGMVILISEKSFKRYILQWEKMTWSLRQSNYKYICTREFQNAWNKKTDKVKRNRQIHNNS